MRNVLAAWLVISSLSCGGRSDGVPVSSSNTSVKAEPTGPTTGEAAAFVKRTDAELRELWVSQSKVEWEKATNITPENEAKAATAAERTMSYLTTAIKASIKYKPLLGEVDEDTRRQLQLLRRAGMPAPEDPAHSKELAEITARMDSSYGKGKACDAKGENCKDLGQLEAVVNESRNPAKLLEAWSGWHGVGQTIKADYERFVSLANEGAQGVGFKDVGSMWRSGYDMSPEKFEGEVERLWGEVKPLYDDLQCYVRRKLEKKYKKKVTFPDGTIPAHILGNMWAQSWSNIFSLVEPYKGQVSPNVTPALKRQKYTPVKMVKLAESFFTSLGMDPLPATFWERSMFTKPKDREVVCHASAWDLTFDDDVRIKMCIKIDQEDLITIHHELGHDYYFHYYHELPVLYQSGANDGFHEAIGDAIALSITPDYLKQVKLLKTVKKNEKAVINQQMFLALDKIAFLPWGLLVDKWRWDVFAGDVTPEGYNDHWWKLRRKYQGVSAPKERSKEAFDPGAKYHIPANVPYTRYFLSFILQFQFHKALCEEAGHKGPLHECSIFGSKEAGNKFKAMLKLGASKPWPDALEALTGTREMSGKALVDYFAPLSAWLKKENANKSCGWN